MMKSLQSLSNIARVAAATLFAGILLTASVARSQTSTWNDPTGRFTLDLTSTRWTETVPADGVLSSLESARARARGKFLTCEFRLLGPVPGTVELSQETANAATQRFSLETLSNLDPEAQEARVEHTNVDGVEVVDFAFRHLEGGGAHYRVRSFYLVSPQGIVQHQIWCGGALPTSAEDEAEINGLLSTLRFLR
ncbi:MAG: hypothetical protein JNJ63_10670 [Hyphomonadaceae bacterium]|nr:hypothetical protein [Hyphomonadaceae bacterium]